MPSLDTIWNYKMIKRTILFVLCFLVLSISLFAQEEEIAWNYEDEQNSIITRDEDVIWVFDNTETEKEEVVTEKKGYFRVPDRKFEIGLFTLGLGISNDFMTASEFFKEKLTIDLDKLSDGFNINANSSISPFFINYNKNNIWGLGLYTGLDLFGLVGLSGGMLTFQEADIEESDIGAAIFTEVNVHGFLTFSKFKIKLKPAVYYPILYAKPNKFSYTYLNKKTNEKDETYLNMELDMRVYTAFPMNYDFDIKDIFNITNITDNISAKPGIDISVGAEYQLSEVLGLTEKFDFLDFDVGIEFVNIPLYSATMEDYMRMIVSLGSDKPIDFFSNMFNNMLNEDSEKIDIDIEQYYKYSMDEYGKEKINVLRPFKMLISVDWHPLDNPFMADRDVPFKIKREWLTVSPIFGFAINPLYKESTSFEGGIKIRLNLVNLFIATFGTGYYDRLWKNSFDIRLNFKVFEIDLGVSMQSPLFLKSWSGGGLGAAFGLKFGW